MSRQYVYVIHKDGLYLMGYQPSGIREFDRAGMLTEPSTCIWSNDRLCAKAYPRRTAERLARLLEADGVESILTEVDNHGDDECGS